MTDRERHIPFRKAAIVDLCADDERLDPADRDSFRTFCRILESVVHFEYHEVLEQLKDAYAPFNRRVDFRAVRTWSAAERQQAHERLASSLRQLVEAANYEEISEEVFEQALREHSLLKIRLHVDFDDFDEVVFFRRGGRTTTENVRDLFGLRSRQITFENYDRVLIYVKFKDAEHFDDKRLAELPVEPGSTIIKLFEDVPRADLEMLFPNAQVRMRTLDKLVIGVPAVVGAVAVLTSKALASLGLIIVLLGFWLGLHDEPAEIDQAALVALGGGIAAIGGYLWRQFNKFKSRKIQFLKMLSDNLYFKNLDNDAGVFHRLLDSAEEEECKEAVLAYFFLLTSGEALRAADVDTAVEAWFEERLACPLDFDISDALGKLQRLGIAVEEDGAYRARPLDEAKAELDARWDAYFDHPRVTSGPR